MNGCKTVRSGPLARDVKNGTNCVYALPGRDCPFALDQIANAREKIELSGADIWASCNSETVLPWNRTPLRVITHAVSVSNALEAMLMIPG